jgi:hydrogenase maturation protease
LLADDGIGVHVVRRLAAKASELPGLRMLDGGALGFRLTAAITGARLVIVVDAAQLGERPGKVRLLHEQALAERVSGGGRISAHESDLLDLLSRGRLEGWVPARLALVEIQPENIDWGRTLSPPVSRALPQACRAVIRTARAWQAETWQAETWQAGAGQAGAGQAGA